jgi:hypothetical protein
LEISIFPLSNEPLHNSVAEKMKEEFDEEKKWIEIVSVPLAIFH